VVGENGQTLVESDVIGDDNVRVVSIRLQKLLVRWKNMMFPLIAYRSFWIASLVSISFYSTLKLDLFSHI
jgi:hypothetical protein